MVNYFSFSFKNLKRRGIRSWLTLLGIFIGILAAAVTRVAGVDKLGSQMVFVASGGMLLILCVWPIISGQYFKLAHLKFNTAVKSVVASLYIISVII